MDDLIDFTPELRAEAVKILNQFRYGPLFMPPSVRDAGGKIGTLILPHHTGGANWPGGALDPETGIMYVSSVTNPDILAVAVADPARSDMGYVGALGRWAGAVAAHRRVDRPVSPPAKVPPDRISGRGVCP